MTDIHARSLAAKLRNLTTELRALDMDLKSGQPATGPLLREFRQALDNVRMTSWTVNELMDARRTSKDPQAVLSFLTAERLRRFSQLVKDLCGDINWLNRRRRSAVRNESTACGSLLVRRA